MGVAIDQGRDLAALGIGDGLREARVRQGLALRDIERETCIRAANLEAIESERFDALPGDVYAAGFIRTYAEQLGLDGGRYAELFRQSREVEPEQIVPALARRGAGYRRRQLLVAGTAMVVLAAALLAVALLHRRETAAAPVPAAAKPKHAAPHPLVLRAPHADSWIVVRFGNAHGKLVWQGTLKQGKMLRFGLARQLWVDLRQPAAVTARVGTKRVRLDPDRSRYVFGRR